MYGPTQAVYNNVIVCGIKARLYGWYTSNIGDALWRGRRLGDSAEHGTRNWAALLRRLSAYDPNATGFRMTGISTNILKQY